MADRKRWKPAMPNNKKKNSRAPAAKKKVVEESDQPPNVMPKKQTLSQAQLSALIFLSLGLSYVIDYSSAVAEANDTKACTSYFSGGVESCSPADVLVIKIKYYVAVSCTVSGPHALPTSNRTRSQDQLTPPQPLLLRSFWLSPPCSSAGPTSLFSRVSSRAFVLVQLGQRYLGCKPPEEFLNRERFSNS